MRYRTKWINLETDSRYTHWSLNYNVPSDDHDSWEWDNTRPQGQRAIHRAWLSIGFWKMFLVIYLWKVKPYKGEFGHDSTKQYGLTFFERSIHLHWGKTWVHYLPWSWEIVRHDLLFPNGDLYYRNKYPVYRLGKRKKTYSWYDILEGNESPYPSSTAETQVAEYVTLVHYTKDGRKQEAKIRLTGEEREWRWTWFKWLPWPRIKKRVVDCWSDQELGEKAGSWKGGMIGWSCPWPEDEDMKQAFWNWYKGWDGR